MTDGDLNDLAQEVTAINRSNGWEGPTPSDWNNENNPDRIPAKLALIHSEVSEALEAYRNNDIANFEEELADVLIRTLHLANTMDIDIETIVREKMEKNKQRGYKHGGKKI